MKRKGAKKVIGRIFSALALVLSANILFCMMGELTADRSAHFTPDYARIDLQETLTREIWTEEDYELLYHQTGLTALALDRMERGEIAAFQDAFFGDYEIGHQAASPVTPHDLLYLRDDTGERIFPLTPLAPLEEGDVIVTSSCHTFGWRNGHVAIVTDAAHGLTLECIGPGKNSGTGLIEWFQNASNFMVLRLKDATRGERKEIATYACKYLTDIPYSIFTGFFTPKDQGNSPKTTHCSHLVWQAFRNFGYELDPDGGPVCTARDIANSEAFELVQVFGFNPDKLWQ